MTLSTLMLDILPFVLYPTLHGGNLATTQWAKAQVGLNGWEMNQAHGQTLGQSAIVHGLACGAQIYLDHKLKKKPKARLALRIGSILILGYAMYRDFKAGDEARAFNRGVR